jgi:hypothetical protein
MIARRLEVAQHIDQEIEAIKAVLLALDPLPPDVRESVLRYVINRLQIAMENAEQGAISSSTGASAGGAIGAVMATAGTGHVSGPTHIKELKDKKQPRSANEMAVLVAYYLAEVAPPNDRRDRITAKEIDTYFKIAEFRPKEPSIHSPER